MNKFKKQPHTKGAAFLLFVVLFMVGSVLLTLIVSRGVYEGLVAQKTLEESKGSFYAADAAVEDAIYRHRKNKNYSATESFTLNGATVNVTRTTALDEMQFTVTSAKNDFHRNAYAAIRIGNGASFNFGLQSHNGGILMQNSSTVIGHVYSNGSVTGNGSSVIRGDVVSAGPSGLITGVHATGSAWAQTIQNSRVDKNAYYQTISSTIVGGTSYPASPAQPTSTLPITDAQIEEWKTHAEAGGTISTCPGGTYVIDSDTTIGPVKIACNFSIEKNGTDVTFAGPVWVEGNFETANGPNLIVSASLPNKSIQIIADKPSDRTNSSRAIIQQSTQFLGAAGNSYFLVVSTNNSSANGGSVIAIDAGNSSPQGEVIYYAPYGRLTASNSVKLRGATAHLIELANSAIVQYETGMVSLLFSGGPGGAYVISDWRETQ